MRGSGFKHLKQKRSNRGPAAASPGYDVTVLVGDALPYSPSQYRLSDLPVSLAVTRRSALAVNSSITAVTE
jgi:hypothetical protein